MPFSISKFSEKKAKKAVINSSKIEGYNVPRDKNITMKAQKIAMKLCA